MNKTLIRFITLSTLVAIILPRLAFGFSLALMSTEPALPDVFVSHLSDRIGSDDTTPVRNEIANGLNSTTFDTLVGTVTVNLPDDLAAGDTISGTVIAEPKKQDTQKNKVDDVPPSDEISGYVVEVAKQETPMKRSERDQIHFCKSPVANTNDYSLTVCNKWSIPNGVSKIPVTLKNKDGNIVGRTEIPVAKKPDPANSPEFFTPPVGQAGKPISIKGPFDGDFTNTAVKVGDQVTKFLASSPRKFIVESPRDLKGPVNIEVEHKGKSLTKCTYRNIGVRLSAEKLNLIKGEQTDLTLMVNGLIGLLSPVSVQLSNRSVSTLNMDGGNLQTIKIEPSQVNGDVYTTQRRLTGLSAGGFSIAAVVEISGYAQGNLNKCAAPRDLPITPVPQPSPPANPDPNPTATPVPPIQPTPSPTPQPTPRAAHGRFQVTLNGFRVIRVTNRGAFQRPDAISFQPEIFGVSTGAPLAGATLHGGISYTIGSSAYPVRGGSAPGGGFRNGDGFPDQAHPEIRTLPLSRGTATIPPTIYYRNYENTELIQGENAVVIIPSIWSIDNNNGLGLRRQFLDTVGRDDTRAAIRAAVTTMINNPPSLALGNFLVPGSTVGIPNTMSLAIGVPQDRPIGMRPVGRQFGFTPQALVLTYESADFMSRTNFGFGPGIVPVRYTDDAAFGGDYELYFQVERVDECASNIEGARFVGSAELSTNHPDAPGPYPGALDLRVNITDCRSVFQITYFPALTNTSETRVGPNTSTVTMYSGGSAAFVRATGAIDLQITLGLVNTHGLFGNSTLPLRLTGSIDPATGIARLRGTGRFSGGQLGTTSTDGTIVITGRFSPMP